MQEIYAERNLLFDSKPLEIFVDDQTKLTLHGLQQYYVKLEEAGKNVKLNDLLDTLEFNQVCIFVKSVARANELNKLLVGCNFPSICIHSAMPQEERYNSPHAALRATNHSKTSPSASWLRPIFSVVALMSRESTLSSTTICPTPLTRTSIGYIHIDPGWPSWTIRYQRSSHYICLFR